MSTLKPEEEPTGNDEPDVHESPHKELVAKVRQAIDFPLPALAHRKHELADVMVHYMADARCANPSVPTDYLHAAQRYIKARDELEVLARAYKNDPRFESLFSDMATMISPTKVLRITPRLAMPQSRRGNRSRRPTAMIKAAAVAWKRVLGTLPSGPEVGQFRRLLETVFFEWDIAWSAEDVKSVLRQLRNTDKKKNADKR